ncbi:Succinate dehydrogenase flavin-adding protein, antitoxin of CptAB toxin-antitoxin [hydrothermal vent metagenome]|uniref:Succinate dehydrogenase flavin-adding protein, antitoxin of CptAB toxin-antitoxin n=1 Tax=hydrothermal vent metagenome TaxID=652676 RepID=A0A3B1AUH9_9ZZZZ
MDRLRWQCRRGLLELDLLFEAFLKQGYKDLSEAEKATFRDLLKYQDQQLQEWLLGKCSPEDAAVGRMVERIRNSVL